jgi:hypothetical protein
MDKLFSRVVDTVYATIQRTLVVAAVQGTLGRSDVLVAGSVNALAPGSSNGFACYGTG